MENETAKLEGFDALAKALEEMESKVAKKVSVAAMKKALKPTLASAKSLAPRKTGALEKSIKIRVLKTRDKETKRVGVATGEKWFQGDTFYGAFLEFGYLKGDRKLGDRRQFIPGEHYLEYAFDETSSQILGILADELANGITKAVKGAGNG